MKITARNWQQDICPRACTIGPKEQDAKGEEEKTGAAEPEEALALPKNIKEEENYGPLKAFSSQNSSQTAGSGGKIKSSVPDDNIGQLASELYNGRTKSDVIQVSSKAMRAMANLRMAGALCEGEDKEKVGQMIRRMNRLIKRIRMKIRNLDKEEQLQKRQEKAEKRKEEQKARTLSNELRRKRNKRRREEWDYAQKEIAAGQNSSGNASPAEVSASSAASAPVSVPASVSVTVSPDMAAPAESVSVDITV